MTKFDTRYIENRLHIPVYAYDIIDSTSSEARRRLADGEITPFLVISDCQSSGRGRQGKSFSSPSGSIYMSYALPAPTENTVSVTTRASVALVRALRNASGADVKIKWVNDIWLGNKKVAGILTEAIPDRDGKTGSLIIGIGVNLDGAVIPRELSDIATALPKCDCTREELIAAISEEINSITACLSDNSYIEEYRENSLVINREISYTVNGACHSGFVKAINSDGSLSVIADGKEILLSSGEITVRMKGDKSLRIQ